MVDHDSAFFERTYGSEFFEQMATCKAPYMRLGDCIADTFDGQFKSVVDFGTGAGYVIERLQELGHEVLGIDGFGTSDKVKIVKADLTTSLAALGDEVNWPSADLVMCTETAEHLPASAADVLVEHVLNAARSAKFIVWSAAPPGQAANDPSASEMARASHINEQPPMYWLARFMVRGWVPSARHTTVLRALMLARVAQHIGCRDSFHVLVPAL